MVVEKIKLHYDMRNLLFIFLLLLSCNPVKKVLKDRYKFDEVAKKVVESGLYCANDTIIQTKSDTLITYDTIVETNEVLNTLYKTDTLKIPVTKKITKTITIRDTIQKVVVDNARINALEAKLAVQTQKTEEYKAKAQNRLKWLILLLIAILIRILYKPLKKFILWHS
jgi:hypothetical protein